MGLFGNDDEQDARLDETERRMRRTSEQVASDRHEGPIFISNSRRTKRGETL